MCACRQKKSFKIEDILFGGSSGGGEVRSRAGPRGPIPCPAPPASAAPAACPAPPLPPPHPAPCLPSARSALVPVPTALSLFQYPAVETAPCSAAPWWHPPAPPPLSAPPHFPSYHHYSSPGEGGVCWWGAAAARRKGGQVRFTARQTSALERRFRAQRYLAPDARRHLARHLALTDRQVKTWFQNRRAKWRRSSGGGGGGGGGSGGGGSGSGSGAGGSCASDDGSPDEDELLDIGGAQLVCV